MQFFHQIIEFLHIASSQLSSLAFDVVIGSNRAIYIAGTRNSRIAKWLENATAGIVTGGGSGSENRTDQLSYPEALFLDRMTDTVYVADSKNSRIMRIPVGFTGGNDNGNATHELSTPLGLTFDSTGNLYVSDRENDRVQMFACISSSGANFAVSLYFLSLIISTMIFFQ